MTLTLDAITRVEDADPDVPTDALSLVPHAPSRRTVLRAAALAGLTVGGSVLSWRPTVLTGPASAAAGYETAPGGKHTGWLACKVDYVPDRDSGGKYRNWRAACNNAQNFISRWYCRRPSGWHRFDSRTRKNGALVDFRIVGNRCWGPGTGFKSRNAWRWRVPNGPEFRCSDGQMIVTRLDGTSHVYNTVCRWKVAG